MPMGRNSELIIHMAPCERSGAALLRTRIAQGRRKIGAWCCCCRGQLMSRKINFTIKLFAIALGLLLIVVPSLYAAEQNKIASFSSGADLFPVRTKARPCYDAFIDKKGEIVLKTPYAATWRFFDGLCLVRKPTGREFGGEDLGFIDTKGNLVIRREAGTSLPHHIYGPFSEGLARISTATGDGFIDRKGKMVIPPKEYQEVWGFNDGMCAVRVKGRYGFIDKNGKMAVPPRYTSVRNFHEGLAVVKINGKSGFVDKAGNLVIPCKYTEVGDFDGGFACVRQDSSCGLIGKNGTFGIEISSKYSACGNFSEGLWPVKITKTKEWCYLDSTGRTIVPPAKYEVAGIFKNGLAPVVVYKKYGFINRAGAMVIAPKFDAINTFFEHGLALVTAKGMPGAEYGAYIDETGKIVWSMLPVGMVLK